MGPCSELAEEFRSGQGRVRSKQISKFRNDKSGFIFKNYLDTWEDLPHLTSVDLMPHFTVVFQAGPKPLLTLILVNPAPCWLFLAPPRPGDAVPRGES